MGEIQEKRDKKFVKTQFTSILLGPRTLVTSDQQTLGLLQWGLVLAEKAYEGLQKGLASRRSHPLVLCLCMFLADAFGEDKQAGEILVETWHGWMWGWPLQVAVAKGLQVRQGERKMLQVINPGLSGDCSALVPFSQYEDS